MLPVSHSDSPDVPALTPASVTAWLLEHPDFLREFLARHPQSVETLLPEKSKKQGNIADFQTYLIERLKADKSEALATAQEVVETARYNMNNQTRIHTAVLRMLEAPTFDQFIDSLTGDLTAMLDVDITTLVVESDGDKIPHITTHGIRIVPEGTIDKWMGLRNILHQSDIGGVEAIYGAGAALVRSQVLIRIAIGHPAPAAILAFGSRNPTHFQPGQGTEQISFLAQVIERLFRAWLQGNN